ncbi:MAG TPA: Ig-like domain-containing protein, partial [Actinomycetota bacterium]|nr:Ig-like domain-containing protein [Actinomycetota bacterium]
ADVEGAEGAQLRLVTNNGEELANVTITNFNFSQTFTVPEDATWVRAEVLYQDGREARRMAQPLCDVSEQVYQGIGLSDEENFYCENRLAMVAMTSPVYFEQESFDPTTTLTYTGATQSKSGDNIDLAATLLDSAGAPLAGQPVVFTFQGRSYTATTDADGRALAPALVRGGSGTSEVVSQFDGTDLYESSTDIDVITVLKGRKRSARKL